MHVKVNNGPEKLAENPQHKALQESFGNTKINKMRISEDAISSIHPVNMAAARSEPFLVHTLRSMH